MTERGREHVYWIYIHSVRDNERKRNEVKTCNMKVSLQNKWCTFAVSLVLYFSLLQNTQVNILRAYLGTYSNWLSFISKDDKTEAKSVLGQRMVILIGREGSTALISIDSSPALHSHVGLEQSTAGSLHVHLWDIILLYSCCEAIQHY